MLSVCRCTRNGVSLIFLVISEFCPTCGYVLVCVHIVGLSYVKEDSWLGYQGEVLVEYHYS